MIGQRSYAAVVVGGGPAGLAAALALGRLGVDVALAGPHHASSPGRVDQRTAALFTGSIELLRNLGTWEALSGDSAPITAIRIVDDRAALLKAPEVLFTAAEVGLQAFGYNVPNEALVSALRQTAAAAKSNVALIETAGVTGIRLEPKGARLHLAEGAELRCNLIVGADGRNSFCRQAAGIATRAWEYPQAALACTFTHSRFHGGISTELHRDAGPFTVVPLPGNASSLVWVETRDEAQRLARLPLSEFHALLERRLHGLLGSIGEAGVRSCFPLTGLSATGFGRSRVALAGEAGHVIPPIGAQGLNLGLRDGAALADCVALAIQEGQDIGGDDVLSSYSNARSADVASRIWTVDLLNRSLLAPFLPVHLARGVGLIALKAFPPLRRFVIREGLEPSFAIPSLMRPQAVSSDRRAEPPAVSSN